MVSGEEKTLLSDRGSGLRLRGEGKGETERAKLVRGIRAVLRCVLRQTCTSFFSGVPQFGSSSTTDLQRKLKLLPDENLHDMA